MDVYALPKAPNRERREEEESERRRPGELGGAFKDYGGDRGGGGGGGYGGGRDRDEDGRRERGDRYDRRGGERGDRYDRRGGDRYGDRGDREDRYGDRGDRYDRDRRDESSRGGRRDDDRDFDEDGESEGASRNRVARIPEIGRRERCCRKEKKDVVVSETAAMGIGDTRIEEKIDEEEANRANRWDRSRADTGDWSKRTSVREDDRYEPVRERPRLNLQKRSEGADKKAEAPAGSSSLFGGAKPVDVKYVEDALRARSRTSQIRRIRTQRTQRTAKRGGIARSLRGRTRKSTEIATEKTRNACWRIDSPRPEVPLWRRQTARRGFESFR